MAGYTYRGTGNAMTEDQVAEHIKGARAKIAAGQGVPPPGRPAAPAAPAPPRPGPEPGVLKLRGAVRVERFPEKSKYPFRQIADDGGIWRLDPAEFKVTPAAITQAAPKWARGNGLAAKTVVDDGQVYVQFTPAGDA